MEAVTPRERGACGEEVDTTKAGRECRGSRTAADDALETPAAEAAGNASVKEAARADNGREIIREQARELSEWREEGKKMVSTGTEQPKADRADATKREMRREEEADLPVLVDAAAVFPFVPGVPAGVFALPPPLLACGDPSLLPWLRLLWESLRSLDLRRREAERITAETTQKGRMAEMNLVRAHTRTAAQRSLCCAVVCTLLTHSLLHSMLCLCCQLEVFVENERLSTEVARLRQLQLGR